ncbi:MAG: Asp-tRNA(Asn)/Glu-tRNA(Gln) amidotransferase subunit GatC [Pseudomonadota bacterium]|nr:Asp-tRNA(Asn)/Glu-tRNA(Gln) amidotransferase subunit GatC [Pseudomonadota bacterium]
MALDQETVRRIATLARIKLPEENLEPLAGELNNILGWIEQLSEVDTDDVQPMTSVVETVAPLRPDVVTDGGAPDQVLRNAPQAEGAFYTVPKVVE